ncbi:MAG TPA: SOS response-associated peptidase [Saprospiraceae bacterium]|nr:SOS response-associated peptidase [Saprospiraceae bacterium]
MCGRASLTRVESALEERFKSTFYSEDIGRYNPLPNYNVAPGQMHPVITNEQPETLRYFKWGLIPFWAKDPKIGYSLINARAETLLDKPAFQGGFKNRRCLIPLDGFYEWRKQSSGISLPFRFVLEQKDMFSVAGIWDTWTTPDKKEILTFSIITVKANETVNKIHGRMPAMLFPSDEKQWLDNSLSEKELLGLLRPFPADKMFAYPVSTKVNSVRFNSPELIAERVHPVFKQGTLF